MAEGEKLPKGTAEKLRKLLAALGELRERETAILWEIDTLMGGGVGVGALLRQAEQTFGRAWSARYSGAQYVWQYAKDRAQMKRLLGSMPIEELERRIVRYLRTEDPFFTKARHSFGLFVTTVNQHASAATVSALELDPENEAPDCKHTPRCQDDAEHTRRRMSDMRA